VTAIASVGSQPVAEDGNKKGTENLKRVQALAGAKNHSIVLKDADLNVATKQIIGAAFGSAGERCMAASVVTVQEEIADQLIERLVEEANDIVIGDGLEENVFLGPVIRENHKERTLSYIESGVQEGAKLIRDGRQDAAVNGNGYFVGPRIFEHFSQGLWSRVRRIWIVCSVKFECLSCSLCG